MKFKILCFGTKPILKLPKVRIVLFYLTFIDFSVNKVDMLILPLVICIKRRCFLSGKNGKSERRVAEKMFREMLRQAELTGNFEIESNYDSNHRPIPITDNYLRFHKMFGGGKGIGIKLYIQGKEIDIRLRHDKLTPFEIKKALDAKFGTNFRFEMPLLVDEVRVVDSQEASETPGEVEMSEVSNPEIVEVSRNECLWENLRPKNPTRFVPTDDDCLRAVLWTILVESGDDLSHPVLTSEIYDWVCHRFPIANRTTHFQFGRIAARLEVLGLLSVREIFTGGKSGRDLRVKEKQYTLTEAGVEVAKGRDIPELPKADKGLLRNKEKLGKILSALHILLGPIWFNIQKGFVAVDTGGDINISKKELERLLLRLADETFYLRYNKAGKVFQLTSCGIAAAEMSEPRVSSPAVSTSPEVDDPVEQPEESTEAPQDVVVNVEPVPVDEEQPCVETEAESTVSNDPPTIANMVQRLKMLFDLRKEIAKHVEELTMAKKTRSPRPTCRLREFADRLDELGDAVATCEGGGEGFLEMLFS